MIYDIEYIDGKEFHKVCKSEELEKNEKKKIDFEDEYDAQLVIFRHEGKLHSLTNICPHMREPKMYKGRIKHGTISCPMHGWRFNATTGLNLNKKVGVKDLKTYDILEKDGYIYVEKPELETPKWMM